MGIEDSLAVSEHQTIKWDIKRHTRCQQNMVGEVHMGETSTIVPRPTNLRFTIKQSFSDHEGKHTGQYLIIDNTGKAYLYNENLKMAKPVPQKENPGECQLSLEFT